VVSSTVEFSPIAAERGMPLRLVSILLTPRLRRRLRSQGGRAWRRA